LDGEVNVYSDEGQLVIQHKYLQGEPLKNLGPKPGKAPVDKLDMKKI
jgi:hypothetical protein